MADQDHHLRESVVIRSLRRLRDRYFPNTRAVTSATESDQSGSPSGFLESLPVNIQFVIMTYLSPADLCLLGATCHYWRGMVRDPLLWRFFLFRDMPYWNSIDNISMPHLEVLDTPLVDENESLDDREDGVHTVSKVDYMAVYLRGSPLCRQQCLPSFGSYKALTHFVQSLILSEEPSYAMFGPGMEQLDVSFVKRLMNARDVLPMTGMPGKQISGIGSGISFSYKNLQNFNIMALYSTNRAERERARVEQRDTDNKLFTVEVNTDTGVRTYSAAPHVQQVCQAVDGFIYVANAERGEGECEMERIRAVLSSEWGSTSRPLLVLSCISREDLESVDNSIHPITKRVPCVYMAKRLELTELENPWMVQDVVVESLSGLLDGISWLLRCSGVKLHYG